MLALEVIVDAGGEAALVLRNGEDGLRSVSGGWIKESFARFLEGLLDHCKTAVMALGKIPERGFIGMHLANSSVKELKMVPALDETKKSYVVSNCVDPCVCRGSSHFSTI